MTTKVYDFDVYGNNKLKAKDLFKERVKYQNEYPDNVSFENTEKIEVDSTNLYDAFTTPDQELSKITIPDPINFWSTKYATYGRKDNNGDYVIPDVSQFKELKQIAGSSDSVFALNFVSDAFEDFVQFVRTERTNRLHPDDFLTKNIQAKRGWYNIDDRYNKNMEKYYDAFVNSFLPQNKLERNIRNFDGFLDVFLNLYMSEMIIEFPLTKTGLLESDKVSPNVSGLCVEMSTDNHDDDYNKWTKYINNINYEFYTLAAAKFGFFVDKNAPWRLVANLGSPVMREYIEKYFFTIEPFGITTSVLDHYHSYEIDPTGKGETIKTDQFYDSQYVDGEPKILPPHIHTIEGGVVQVQSVAGETQIPAHAHGFGLNKKYNVNWTDNDFYNQYYTRTYLQDIQELKARFKRYYNLFVTQFPSIEIPVVCSDNKGSAGGYYGASSTRKTVMKTIDRKFLTDDQFNKKYDDLFWLKTYLLVRIKERTRGQAKLDDKLNKVMSDINQLYYFVDKQSALEYIQQYLKQYY
jgi:hypothetical protein